MCSRKLKQFLFLIKHSQYITHKVESGKIHLAARAKTKNDFLILFDFI